MAKTVRIPVLGQSVEEVRIVRWLRAVGDSVEAGTPIAEVETDKTNIEWESPESGTLLKILIAEGAYAAVEAPALVLGVPGEAVVEDVEARSEHVAAAVPSAKAAVPATAPVAVRAGGPMPTPTTMFSPRARRVADELGMGPPEFAGIVGSGPKGRIIERDVLARYAALEAAAGAALAAAGSSPKISPLARAMATKVGMDLATVAGTGGGGRILAEDVRAGAPVAAATVPLPDGATRKPLEGLRKRVADNLARSVREKPHVTLHTRVDAGALMDLRKALLPRIEEEVGVRLSPTDLIVWACGIALARCPWMNGTIDESGITTYAEAHVGLAVSLGTDGLVVPVLRNASTCRIARLVSERTRLVGLARDGKLGSAELAGATFTVTNLGNFGVDAFNPIIPPPQIAILGVGSIRDEVVARAGVAVVRPTMGLSLSFDHRAVDGAPAGEFLQVLAGVLEDPVRELG